MFNQWHIGYIVGSLLFVVAALLVFCLVPYFRRDKVRNWTLFILGSLCFLVHISVLWSDFFQDIDFGTRPHQSVFFILYPCNASMWCLLIVGIMALLNRFGKVFNWLAAGTAYIGIIGALVTILGEPYLDSQEAWGSWYLIKSAVSHTILLLGCVYILAGKFVKIRVHGVIPTFVLGLVYGVIGFIDILIFAAIDHDTNPMYIKEPIKSGMEPLYGWMLLIISVVIVFIFTSVWELCFYKKDERFYKNFHAEELF